MDRLASQSLHSMTAFPTPAGSSVGKGVVGGVSAPPPGPRASTMGPNTAVGAYWHCEETLRPDGHQSLHLSHHCSHYSPDSHSHYSSESDEMATPPLMQLGAGEQGHPPPLPLPPRLVLRPQPAALSSAAEHADTLNSPPFEETSRTKLERLLAQHNAMGRPRLWEPPSVRKRA